MNEPQWTKGPWDVSIGTLVGGRGVPDESVAIVRAGSKALAQFRGVGHVENATLVAAAPDLYDALAWMVALAPEDNPYLQQAATVLARARGEQP